MFLRKALLFKRKPHFVQAPPYRQIPPQPTPGFSATPPLPPKTKHLLFSRHIRHSVFFSYIYNACTHKKPPTGRKRTGIHKTKGVFVRFGFDVLELRKLYGMSRTKQPERPVRCYYPSPYIDVRHGIVLTFKDGRFMTITYIRVGISQRCSFRHSGQCEGLNTWNGQAEWLRAFLFMYPQDCPTHFSAFGAQP